MAINAQAIYEKIKGKRKTDYVEEVHCPKIINVMADRGRGTMAAFCVECEISETTFYNWLRENELFLECFGMAKMFAKYDWEQMGLEIKDEVSLPGTTNNKMEYWKMVGWERFGIGKTARVRLKVNALAKPNEQYAQLIRQASEGDFTAGELKQLMEAINVGMNAHQVFELQKEIDQLRADLAVMTENSNGNNTFTDKRTS